MNYLDISKIVQIITTIVLIVLVLIQSKGTGLAQGLKGSFGAYRSLRGVEKGIFILTIISGLVLVANSLLIVILS